MPITHLHIIEGRSPDVKQRLMETITHSICECLGTKPEQVRILIHEVPKENWGVGGAPKEYTLDR